MKQHLIAISTMCTVIFAGASLALAQEVECADVALEACVASFSSVPTYIESGSGTCVYQGTQPALNGGLPPRLAPPTDVLQVTVAPLPVCKDCNVVVTAVWDFSKTDVSQAKTTPWPHEV